MSKVFVIPDIHLKPWVIEKADEIISVGTYDHIVMLGDLVDDFGQEQNIDLYNKTFDSAIEFAERHPNTLFCYANHELAYIYEKPKTSGYSIWAKEIVKKRLMELKQKLIPGSMAYIHYIDGVLYSHAGLMKSFVEEHLSHLHNINEIVNQINSMEIEQLWRDNSPLWARCLYGGHPYTSEEIKLQIVGHTAVERITRYESIAILDTFSSFSDGSKGEGYFVYIENGKINVL